jgi:tetraprenyl-beta-curcumene synthase
VKAAKEIAAAASALAAYRLTVLPTVDRELRRWRRQAARIPAPEIRKLALAALEEKATNVEAVAVLATLAPRSNRRAALEAIVPLQVAVDYLDSIEETGHAARDEAEDGGYLGWLQTAWRQAVASLPSASATVELVERAAKRSGEGQAQTHAAEHRDAGALETWARGLPSSAGYRWWELAAGASSSVAAHALIAAAATPGIERIQAKLIDAAYYPSIGALTVLLDSLVDRGVDAAVGAHNYTDYYSSADDAAERIAAIALDARSAIAPLRKRGRHQAILVGVAAFYVSQPGAREPFAKPVHAALTDTLGPSVRLLANVLALRHNLRTGA